MGTSLKILFFLLFFPLFFACSSPKGLKFEEEQRAKRIDSYKVDYYRCAKALLRAPTNKIENPQLKKFKQAHQSTGFRWSLASLQEIYNFKNLLFNIDEDSLPSLTQNLLETYAKVYPNQPLYENEINAMINADAEHFLLAGFWYLNSVQLNSPEFALYELSRIRNESLPYLEMRLIHKMLLPYIYLDQGWPFLSIKSAEESIQFLDEYRSLLQGSVMFKTNPFTLETASPLQTWHQFRAIAFLTKGIAAYSEDRSVALNSFEIFLKEAQEGQLPLEPKFLTEVRKWMEKEKSFDQRAASNLMSRLTLNIYENLMRSESLKKMKETQKKLGWEEILEFLKTVQNFDWKNQGKSYFQKTQDYIQSFF